MIKIKIFFDDENTSQQRIESLWASHFNEHFKIENIPFYVMNFAYGDIISTKKINGELYVDELIQESGHSTIRIIFFDKTIIENTRNELKEMGCSSEISENPLLIAIDVPPDTNYESIVLPYLINGQQLDLWDYQEACLG